MGGTEMVEFTVKIICRDASTAENVRNILKLPSMTKEQGPFSGYFSVKPRQTIKIPLVQLDHASTHRHDPHPKSPNEPINDDLSDRRYQHSALLMTNHDPPPKP